MTDDVPGRVPAGAAGRFDGVVLAGGTSRRFGGGDKTTAVVGGRSLLGHAVQALADAGAGTVVVVGPRLPTDVRTRRGCRLVLTREEPPGSGPGSGLHAGLSQVEAEQVVVLAADLPGVDARAVSNLLSALAAAPSSDGVVPQDAEGRAQWLTAAYRTGPLAAAARDAVTERSGADGSGAARGPGLRDVVGRIGWTVAPMPSGWGRLVDVDTPEDLSRARLDDWARRLVDELDLHAATGQVSAPDLVDLVLDLARDAAHTIARPAAPLTTFALGVAAGLAVGGPDGEHAGGAAAADPAGAGPGLAALRDRILAMLPPETPAAPPGTPAGPASEPGADGDG